MTTPSGTLFIVATPIGNLGDISTRALATLREADLVLAEDTRVTAKLLAAYEIKAKVDSFHEHTDTSKLMRIVERLARGEQMALVTDAGTPGISDPGGKLVAEAVKAGVRVVPIPGASALVAALSISGLAMDRFTFVGFPPHKKGRQTFFSGLAQIDHVIVLYESTHRIVKTLEALRPLNRSLVVCRELTKLHETVYRGSADQVLEQLQKTSLKGEFVIVVG